MSQIHGPLARTAPQHAATRCRTGPENPATRRQHGLTVALTLAALSAAGCGGEPARQAVLPGASASPSPSPSSSPSASPTPYDGLAVLALGATADERDGGRLRVLSPVLQVREGGDASSWREAGGRVQVLGGVSASPGCGAAEGATARRALTVGGVQVRTYAMDGDRRVVEAYDAQGRNVARALAQAGWVDAGDPQENPVLGVQLAGDVAAAKAADRGRWGALCAPKPPPPPPPPPAPEPDPVEEAPGSGGDVYYENCDAVRAAGAAPIRRGEPGYRSGLDRDGDGQGCGAD